MSKRYEGKHLLVLDAGGWEYAERKKGKSAAAVVAVTDDDRLVLIEQFRKPVNARVVDLPAGLVGDESEGEDPAETARRELEEETGFTCRSVEPIASGPSSPGITSEIIHLFRAAGLETTGEGGGVEGEEIEVHRIPRGDVEHWLRRKRGEGVLIDMKVWAGLYFLMKST